MALLARVPFEGGMRAHFALAGYRDVMRLPLELANKMMEQMEEWRAQEKAPTGRQAGAE